MLRRDTCAQQEGSWWQVKAHYFRRLTLLQAATKLIIEERGARHLWNARKMCASQGLIHLSQCRRELFALPLAVAQPCSRKSQRVQRWKEDEPETSREEAKQKISVNDVLPSRTRRHLPNSAARLHQCGQGCVPGSIYIPLHDTETIQRLQNVKGWYREKVEQMEDIGTGIRSGLIAQCKVVTPTKQLLQNQATQQGGVVPRQISDLLPTQAVSVHEKQAGHLHVLRLLRTPLQRHSADQ